jgi:hypothetical protein
MSSNLRWSVTLPAAATLCLTLFTGCTQSPAPMAQTAVNQTPAPAPQGDAGDPLPMRGLGVCTHMGRMPNWDADKVVPLLKEMGVSVIREEMGWGGVEKTKGVYALPPGMAHWFDAVAAAGIKVFVVLDYGNKIYENELDPQAYANYAGWMAKTLKGKVAAYDLWNEPDNFYFLKQYGGPRDGRDHSLWVVKYGELVRLAAAAIRKADPDAVIVHNLEGPAWVYALQNAPQDYAQVDGVDMHPYPVRYPAETVPGNDSQMAKLAGLPTTATDTHSMLSSLDIHCIDLPQKYLGHPLQCWVGEYGYSTYQPLQGGHWAGFTEEAQADYEVRGAVTGLVHGVKAWCIYDFVDETNDPHDVESNFGMVEDITRGYRRKPAFFALQRLARHLGPDWQLVANPPAKLDVNLDPMTHNGDAWQANTPVGFVKVNGPEVHWFRVGNDYVTILWRAGWRWEDFNPPSGTITWQNAPAGMTVRVQNLTTGAILAAPLTQTGGTVTLSDLPVGGSPIAIRWVGAAQGR